MDEDQLIVPNNAEGGAETAIQLRSQPSEMSMETQERRSLMNKGGQAAAVQEDESVSDLISRYMMYFLRFVLIIAALPLIAATIVVHFCQYRVQ